MPKFLRFPWLKRFFTKGIIKDLVKDNLPEGYYTGASNMRPVTMTGDTGAIQAIAGEQILYPQSPGPLYVCIGTASINGHVVEFWASQQAGQPVIIRIDGIVMVSSALIPYVFNRPLQIAVVEHCASKGVLFPADHKSPPLYWDIGKIIDAFNSGSQEFFGNFTVDSVLVALSAHAHFFVFMGDGIVDVGPGGGLPVGNYSYAPRYRTVQGDVTNWGPETTYIPVPFNYDPVTYPVSAYPGGKTVGGPANNALPTRYGVKMRIRIDNIQGFSELEIKRRRVTDGAPLGTPALEEVIARIPISPNQFGVVEFIDPVNSNLLEVLGPDEPQIQNLDIDAPKGVEYADKRLLYANFMTPSKIADLQFGNFSNGLPITAFTKKIVKNIDGNEVPDGYFNPKVSATMMKYMSGEKYGFGILPWTGSLGRAPVVELAQSFQFPNRRDVKGAAGQYGQESLDYSDDACYAADVNNVVGETFECMTQGSVAKDPDGGPINFIPNYGSYSPWRPNDVPGSAADSYGISPVFTRLLSESGIAPANIQTNTGAAFAPTYHSLGVLVGPVTNIPEWVKAITVVRTAPAETVICEGVGVYNIRSFGFGGVAGKDKNSLVCNFPDMDKGIVPLATQNDIIQNPGLYKVRFVSPQGIYTEPYAFSGEQITINELGGNSDSLSNTIVPWLQLNLVSSGLTGTSAAWCLDMISYARVMHDSGDVNVGDTGVHGFQPAFGVPAAANQTGYAAWRNNGATLNGIPTDGDDYSFWLQGGNNGNTLLDIDSFTPRTSEQRGQSWVLKTAQDIYYNNGQITANRTAFTDPLVKKFHQPVYMIQLIKTGAVIHDSNTQPYINTGATVLMDSCIGIYNGVDTQFELIDERWEDCSNYLPSDFRYIYIVEPGGAKKIYVALNGNVYFTFPANLTNALNNIAANGFWVAPDGTQVNGFYQTSTTGDSHFVNIGVFGFLPAVGSRISVRYDPDAPIRAFGGDTTIAPSTFAPIDRYTSRDLVNILDDGNKGLAIGGLPLPYAGFGMNPNYFMPENGSQIEAIPVADWVPAIRQWVIMSDCETRQNQAFAVTENSTTEALDNAQTFPAIHYINRSFHVDSTYTTAVQYGWYNNYDNDYPGEVAIWRLGGLRFIPEINYDYPKKQDPNYVGIPQSGYVERTDWCTSIAASNKFDPSQQDVPNLRTFTFINVKDLSEETGEIKVIKSGRGPDANYIYAWTQDGVCKIPTDRSVISNVDGTVLGTQVVDGYWGQEQWLTRNIGLPDEMWRLWTFGPTPPTYQDSFLWPNREGFFIMTGDQIRDITRNRILSRVRPILSVSSIGTGYDERLASVYDPKYNEVLFSINPKGDSGQSRTVLVYNALNGEWTAEYTYQFDEYLCHDSSLLGMRNLTTYTLDAGTTIGGNLVTGYVEVPMTDGSGDYQEFCRFKVYGDKPHAVDILDQNGIVMCHMDQTNYGINWVKDYNGWENWVARCDFNYDVNNRLVQDNLFFMRIYFRGGNRTTFKFAAGQLKKIK